MTPDEVRDEFDAAYLADELDTLGVDVHRAGPMIDYSIFSIHRWDLDDEITEAYGAECPHCAQVVHVPGVEEARAALNLHLAAGTDTRCAYWPDTGSAPRMVR